MSSSASSHAPKRLSPASAALAAATNLALAQSAVPAGEANASPEHAEATLTRATITLRAEDEKRLNDIDDYLNKHERRKTRPLTMLVQIAIRGARIGPELLELARAIRAQDGRGRKTKRLDKV